MLHFFSVRFRKYDGQIFLLYLIWYGTERFFVEALRTDSLFIPVVNLKISQVIAVITVVLGMLLLFKFGNKKTVYN